MTFNIRNRNKTTLVIALALGLGACGGSKGGDPNSAQLTIIGDQNVFMDYGVVQTLTVRYHDGNDRPLLGQVDFEIVGAAPGASISKTFGVTNSEGVVQLQLTAGTTDATFQVQASADSAAPTAWTIAVSDGAVPNLDARGRYSLNSKFDVVSGLDNTVGDVLNTFIDMTDGPNDPATWIIDELLKGASSGVRDVVNLFRGVIDPAVNEKILEYAPGFVQDLLDIGEMTGDVARNFGVNSELDIRSAAQNDVDSANLGASHVVTGVNFDIQGTLYSFSMADMNATPIRAEGINVSKDAVNDLLITEHAMPLSYGSMIIIALEEAIIPLVDPGSNSLAGFLSSQVNCTAVGQAIFDEIDFGNAGLYESLCEAALVAAAGAIIDQLQNIDNDGVVLNIAGKARPRDTNGDRKVDQLSAGTWHGNIDYAGTPATLEADKNSFTGTRMGN